MSVDAVNSAAEPAILNKALTSFTSEMLLSEISHSLNDSKAEDLVRIDLRGRSTIGDYMVVVSGRSSRQVNAIAQNLADHLKQRLKLTSRLEGKDSGDWIVVDTGDVIVHIFRPEVREFYQLEKMWQSNIADASDV